MNYIYSGEAMKPPHNLVIDKTSKDKKLPGLLK